MIDHRSKSTDIIMSYTATRPRRGVELTASQWFPYSSKWPIPKRRPAEEVRDSRKTRKCPNQIWNSKC